MLADQKSPHALRDSLVSHSPDQLKSSILRESGMGWTSPPPEAKESQNNGTTILPLRIAKRESPRSSSSQLARRTSSSYKHVRNNNLVTKSPFKSHIPMPSTPKRPSSVAFPPTRRVSGEKRPRPRSIHEQAETENERPFALKRERRQSKGFQNLLEKEPVSKSPFRLQQHTASPQSCPPSIPSSESRLSIASTSQSTEDPTAALHNLAPNAAASPARSSLVSRRLHGPRLSGSGRRERRKTVSFDERCDVVEFAPEEDEEEEVFESAEDDVDGEGSDEDSFFHGAQGQPSPASDVVDEGGSFDSIHLSGVEEGSNSSPLRLDPDVSITGLVDEMFSNAAADESSAPTEYSTPPRSADIPPDLETENGVPLGYNHHDYHQNQRQSPHPIPLYFLPDESQIKGSPSIPNSPSGYPFNLGLSPRASPHGQPSTPWRSPAGNVTSTPPLGGSIHADHVQGAREGGNAGEYSVVDGLERLSVSPSPMEKSLALGASSDSDAFVPLFDITIGNRMNEKAPSSPLGPDPITHEEVDDSVHEDWKDDSLNLSIGNSEISLTSLGKAEDLITNAEGEQNKASTGSGTLTGNEPVRSFSPRPIAMERSQSSPLVRGHSCSPNAIPPRMSSPLFRAGSPLLAGRHRSGSNSSLTGRQRITREGVQRRLLHRQSIGSPAPESEPESNSLSNVEDKREPARDEKHIDWLEQDSSVGEPLNTHSLERIHNDEAREVQMETVDVKLAQDHDIGTSMTPLARGRNDTGPLPPEGLAESPKGRIPDRPNSLGVLNRSSCGDVKMGSVSSGSSGNSSETVVEVSAPHLKIEFKDTDMDMKSALDRLMDDVAGAGGSPGEDSTVTEGESYEATANSRRRSNRVPLARAMTEPTPFLHTSTSSCFSPDNDKSDPSIGRSPPVPPPKDNIKHREKLILEKRREMRQIEAELDEEAEHSREYFCPPRSSGQEKNRHVEQRVLGVGRPSRRRSMSTGDAEVLRKRKGEGLLDAVVGGNNDALADSIEKELKKLVEPQTKAKYHVREREGTIYASSSDPDGVAHVSGPGDVNTGKAWRTVRRPSDMNEYSKLIKEYRAQEKPGKAYGRIFVKILGIKNMHLPLPQQATSVACTLNNGIHFVTTPECRLDNNTRIDQEFELIEQNKLEFTLTLKVRRDPHIVAQFKALSPPPPPVPASVVQAPPPKGGMRSFFSSSPKKSSKDKVPAQPLPAPVHRLPENLARYMKPDGTLARAFVAFKDIATRCDARLFETSYPLIGQRLETGGKFSTQQVGELVLQIFRLPPLLGIAPDQLPQSLEDCCRGLRHINWHKVTYFEGTLTQYGGGCMTWKRRRFRVIGANLVAFNDVTKKATATIDLKKAITIEDDQQGRGTPASGRHMRYDDDDYLYGVERSFRLVFPNDEEIVFFADSDEEKSKWLEIFRALVGYIPPHPLWGELLWQRQEELATQSPGLPKTYSPTA